jgi:hypothetical protein
MFLSIVCRFKIRYINICNVMFNAMHRNLYLMMEEISLEVTQNTSILKVPGSHLNVFFVSSSKYKMTVVATVHLQIPNYFRHYII